MNKDIQKAIILDIPMHWEYNPDLTIWFLINSDNNEILETCMTYQKGQKIHNFLTRIFHANIPGNSFADFKTTDRIPF